MKKFILLLFLLTFFGFTANSQTATIQSAGGAVPGLNSTVDIVVSDFTPNLGSFQFTITFDTNYVEFDSVAGITDWYPGITGVAFFSYWNTMSNSRVITCNWAEVVGLVIPNGSVLCKLNFKYKSTASGCMPINWSDSPTPRLFADDLYNEYSVNYTDGQLCLCIPVSIVSQPSNQSFCNTTGSANFSVAANGDSPFIYQWQYYNGSSWNSVVNGTPAGATYTNANTTTMTVAGITAANTYQYRCYVTNCAATQTATSNAATLTVTPNNTISLTSGNVPQTVCINTAISNITYNTTGATGASVTGLPAGVTGAWSSNVVTISGTPAASGTFNYSISLTGGCGTVSTTGAIIVRPNMTAGAASSSPTLCINTPLTAITHATTQATGIGAPTGLPVGVTATWASNVITISGTPGASGTFNYTIPLTGGCGTANATGTIIVRPNMTAGAASSSPTLCINTALTAITHTTTLATGIGIPTGLPAGVTAAWASNLITISGTPSVSGTFNYSIPLTGGCGTVNATGTIVVRPNMTAGAASSSPTLCINTALTAITHTTTQATGIGAPTGLPAGITAAWASNVISISGTPSVSGTFNYSIPLTGGCGTVYATGTIIVVPNMTAGAASSSPTLCINTPLTAITHATTRATGIGSPTGLPAGVTAAWASNVITISGTPGASGTFNYSIPLTGGCGTVNATGTIIVTPNMTAGAASSSPTLCINTALTVITHTTTLTTGIGIPAGLPAGVTAAWASNVITISGTPGASGTFNYSIPLTGGCGTVNATGTIIVVPNMTAGAASSSPTLCINTPLTAITHTTTQATGIGAPTGLPAGVTAVWASNIITISGTPSASGTFNYSIPLTGGCGTVYATGTIIVRTAMTAGAASSSPTVCINTTLTAITHTTTLATGIGIPAGLPAGVTAVWASNIITINGTPSVSGTFNYSIPLTGGCGTANATGTIIVTPNMTAGAASSSPTLCINTALTAITHATTRATGIGAPTGLPAGVTAAWASNVITISGTPSVSGTFNYSIPLTGGCGTVYATGTIIVAPNMTAGAASYSPTLCINNPLTAITHATTQATGIGAPTGMPAGVTAGWASNVITISGTPSVSGTFNYSIPLTGGCGTVYATGTIIVTPNMTAGAASSSPTLCINTALTAITHTTTLATGIGIPTGLPAGVTAAWASNLITISGTPSVTGTFNYSIPLTGGCGTVNATGTIIVTPNMTAGAASSSPTLCINTAMTTIIHTTTLATGIGTATGLPAGVSAVWATNVIFLTGTPSESGTFNYSIPLTGGCGTVYATGTIVVMPDMTAGAASSNPIVCINTPLTAITHATTGATGIGTPTGLPIGLLATWASDVITISGAPGALGTFNYSIPLAGGCGTATATGMFIVTPDMTVSAASSYPTLCINTVLPVITHTTTLATGIGTPTGLPAGVTAAWASDVITISGMPYESGTFNYSIPLTGDCGTVYATGTIIVTPEMTAGDATSNPFCINTPLTPITHLTVGATGIGTPMGLPAGITAEWASNVITISGTPTESGTFNYSIPLTGGCGTVYATGMIFGVPDISNTMISAPGTDEQTLCINTPITDITYSPAGAWVMAASGLPNGVTVLWASNVITISGTPTVSGTFVYTIELTGCGTITSSGTITVTPGLMVGVNISESDNNTCVNTNITYTASPVNGGGSPTYQWYVNESPVGNNSSTFSSSALNNGDSVRCLITSDENCVINNPQWSNTIHMVFNLVPTAEAGPDATYMGTPVQIGDPGNGPGTISWSPVSGLNDPFIGNPLASPTTTTTYILTVNNNGCVSTDVVTVDYGILGHIIAGKTRYLKKAIAGNPAPNPPTYNAATYNIDNVEVKLKTSPGGVLVATTMSNASGVYQFTNVPDGDYTLTYDHIPYPDTMQYVNHVNAVDLALLKYNIGHNPLTDPSRNFSDKHRRGANVDNNASVNTVDVARISAKIGLPYDPARNFPKGNWVAFDTVVTVAGADLNVTLQTVAYGDYDASSIKYQGASTNWGMAKVLPDENIIIRSDESIMMSDPEYFEVPLRISTKMNELSAVGLELSYPSDKYKLVSASMSNTGKTGGAIKINPTLDEIIAANNDLLVTDDQGIIRVVYATTDFFDIAANDELVRLGFRSLNDPGRGELDFNLSGTGLIANQYGEINEDAYLTMPKIFVQGDLEAGFEFTGYPNPFKDEATLTYSIPENGTVKLNVYNSIGELVTVLVNEYQISGKHLAEFSLSNLSAGVYTFKLDFAGLNKSKCMVLKLIH